MEPLEVEIIAAVEDFRKRAIARLEECAGYAMVPYSEGNLDEEYGRQQGYERAAEELVDIPVREADDWPTTA